MVTSMNYEEYLTKQEVLGRVENAFPFVKKPKDDELYIYDKHDLMRKIIQSKLSAFCEPELPYEGVMLLYSEFSTISMRAVEWLFPSLLRLILKEKDRSGLLHWYLPTYLENINLDTPNSAYNFSWLSSIQLNALNCMMKYLSEVYGDSTGAAQDILCKLTNKI